jgi:hypothetical protein
VAIPRGNASIIYGASYHVWDLPSVIICDDVAKDPSDRLSLLTSAKSYISESRYLARYYPANIPWPMTRPGENSDRTHRCIAIECKIMEKTHAGMMGIEESEDEGHDSDALGDEGELGVWL